MDGFRFGLRFRKFRNLCVCVVAVMVFGFYFIYEYIYGQQAWWSSGRMAVVFLCLGAGLVLLTAALLERMRRTVCYRLTERGLEFSAWGRTVCYPYREFRKAYHRFGGPFDTVPVVFELTGNRKMELNQYISGLPELTVGLLERIGEYAELEEGIFDFASGVYTVRPRM